MYNKNMDDKKCLTIKNSELPDKRTLDSYCRTITADQIASSLQPLDIKTDIGTIYKEMQDNDFDIICIRESSKIVGYVEKSDIMSFVNDTRNILDTDIIKPFVIYDLIATNTPIIDVICILSTKEKVFVLNKAEISGIITIADIQKIPVRVLLYGLISVLENQLEWIIRDLCQTDIASSAEDYVMKNINPERFNGAKRLYMDLKMKNHAIDIVGCLQLCDKLDFVRKTIKPKEIGFNSSTSLKSACERIEKLRNIVAHSNNISMNFSCIELHEIIMSIKILSDNLCSCY